MTQEVEQVLFFFYTNLFLSAATQVDQKKMDLQTDTKVKQFRTSKVELQFNMLTYTV